MGEREDDGTARTSIKRIKQGVPSGNQLAMGNPHELVLEWAMNWFSIAVLYLLGSIYCSLDSDTSGFPITHDLVLFFGVPHKKPHCISCKTKHWKHRVNIIDNRQQTRKTTKCIQQRLGLGVLSLKPESFTSFNRKNLYLSISMPHCQPIPGGGKAQGCHFAGIAQKMFDLLWLGSVNWQNISKYARHCIVVWVDPNHERCWKLRH